MLMRAILGLIFVIVTFGQTTNKPTAPEQGEDVLRINAELVQTDVMVFDQRGRFVDGLRPEDFELRIDGQPRNISFFDRVTAGSRTEDSQLAAARGQSRSPTAPPNGPVPLDRGRTIFFFVDDLHLAAANLTPTRNLLSYYVDKQMRQNDQAAITSASGQIGFLQQITDSKEVLHGAVARLKTRPSLVRDFDRPPMSEYQALAIERNNTDVISYFVDELMKDITVPAAGAVRVGSLPRTRAEQQVRDRAHLILQQAAAITTGTLSSLESLVRSAAKLPGRKLVFFMSDGFFLDLRNSDSLERLRVITSAAARSGVVIYSVDVRGLTTGIADASSEAGVDPGGRLQGIAAGEIVESQDGMNALAVDTGGRGIFNTNSLDAGINKAIDETSTYYLLAWRPDNAEQRSEKFRAISVSVVGRPDLLVRTRQGFFAVDKTRSRSARIEDERPTVEKSGESRLFSAVTAAVPQGQLPVSLSLTYVNSPNKGLVLTIALQVRSAALAFAPSADKQEASVEIAGLVLNDEGKTGASFTDHPTVDKPASAVAADTRDLTYSYPITIPPGLYQVRIGLRDQTSGAIGTAQDWIEIPDLSKTAFVLSSLIISERLPGASATADDLAAIEQLGFSVDHRFHRNSFLRLLSFIYSAQPQAKPDIVVQLQILRDNEPVLTTSFRKVTTEGIPDPTRLAYAAEISLEHLLPGRYLLQMMAIDRATRKTAVQRARFQIE
jgi:VWFA-related protein